MDTLDKVTGSGPRDVRSRFSGSTSIDLIHFCAPDYLAAVATPLVDRAASDQDADTVTLFRKTGKGSRDPCISFLQHTKSYTSLTSQDSHQGHPDSAVPQVLKKPLLSEVTGG